MTKLYSLIIALTALLGTATHAHAQTLYNSQSGGSGSYYNGGSAPLNLKAITQGKQASGNQYRSARRPTRDAFTASSYSSQADALQAYRAQRDQQAQSAYANQLASITKLSENVGTPHFHANGQTGQTGVVGTGMGTTTYGMPVRQIYRGADKPNISAPKKVFNSRD